MSTDEKTQELYELVTELTLLGDLQWSETPDENTFRARLGSGSVRLAPAGNPGGETADRFSLTVSDQSGRVIETFSPAEGAPGHQYLATLFPLVRRSVLGLDSALENILSELRTRKENQTSGKK